MTLKVLGNEATIAWCRYILRGVEGHIELGWVLMGRNGKLTGPARLARSEHYAT
jgi:hypothetical protein